MEQGILAARREVAAATKKRQQTEAQIQDLKSQHESQVQNSGGSLEQMELEIAELTRELQTLRHEVRGSSHCGEIPSKHLSLALHNREMP